MSRMYRTTAAAAFQALLLVILIAAAASAKEYMFQMPVPKGISIGSVPKLLRSASAVLEKKTGVKITVEDYTYEPTEDPIEVLLKNLDDGKVQFAMVFAIEYTRYKRKHEKTKAVPLFTVEMFGKTTYDICMCTRKASKIKSVKKLKGKTWGGGHTTYANYILYKNKIKTAPEKFFEKMIYIPDENIMNVFDALLAKKIDVTFMTDYQIDMVRNTDKKYQKIKKTKCVEYEHNWIIVVSKDVPKKDAGALRKAFLGAHKDKDFAQFRFLLTAIKGKFVPFESSKLKNSEKIGKLFDKYDWREKEKDFLKKNMK